MHRRGEPYLIPPGTRKNNAFFIIRGNFGGKTDNEKSTGTDDEELAEQMLAQLIYDEKRGYVAQAVRSFEWCTEQYIAWRNPPTRERTFLKVICQHIGDMPIHELTQADLVATANTIYSDTKASTKNRAVMRPASAVIHYAAKSSNGWCHLWQVELFPEDPVKKRSMSLKDAQKLVNATSGMQKLFLLWLFKHGDRVTGTIETEGKNIHLKDGYYDRLTGKKKKHWRKAPLDPEVKAALADVFGRKLPQGRVFPWPSRWATYRWLKPLSKRLKVKFSPHMARHSILSWIGDAGGNSIQIKTRAGHASLKSSEPYLTENLDVTRDITAQFVLTKIRGTIRGKKSKKSMKLP